MTDRISPLQADLWREVGRHLRIHESAPTIVRLLAGVAPVAAVVFREFDASRRTVATIAAAGVEPFAIDADGRAGLSDRAFRRLLRWCESGVIASSSDRPAGVEWPSIVPALLPDAVWSAAPLTDEGSPLGLVIVIGAPRKKLDASFGRLMSSLAEPLAAAMRNDLRLRELAALRDAAEAEKQALLTRLGRQDGGDAIVGADAGLRPVMERVGLVARSDAPVLILGETGTGKEVIARAIHAGSPRARGPFIRVNCGAIPSELIDSQLFGHEKGAFTGAIDQRRGWFERADGGTLFLDEIGELPQAAQVRLLRILQDGHLERVGGQDPIRVDVRMVAATHRDLAAMAREGRFREDLWYRIAVFPVLLPPLRERVGDIPALSRHFARRAARRFGLTPCEPTEADIAVLRAYDWPGNVRELASVIDRASILGDGRTLEVEKALGAGLSRGSAPLPLADCRDGAPSAGERFPTLDDAMRAHIEQSLRATLGRIEGRHGAARLLDINPHTLRSRMRKLGVRWRDFRTSREK